METYLYVISCKDSSVTDRYIGYTTDWDKCLEYRSEAYDNGSNATSKLYTFVREHGGWDNWDMTIVGTYGTRDEALMAKLGLLEKHEFSLNTRTNR
jgi:predicted GIY-YIG superfamily endonuclease